MARLKTSAISEELRVSLAAYPFAVSGIVLATIPTGGDPRMLIEADDLPQALVNVTSTVTKPLSIGGGSEAFHGLEIWVVSKFVDGDDISLIKNKIGEDLFDWLCSAKQGTNYKLFI